MQDLSSGTPVAAGRPLGRVCLLWQAGVAAVAGALALFLAAGTSEDIRRTGQPSLHGVSIGGCLTFAACMAVCAAVLVVCGLRVIRSTAARRLGLVLQVVIGTSLIATTTAWCAGSPIVAVFWLGLVALTGLTAVSLFGRQR